MFNFLKNKTAYLLLFLTAVTMGIISGCDDAGVVSDPVISHVEHFDSLEVSDNIDLKGLNLYMGTTVHRDSASKDAELVDSAGTFMNYYLRSGHLSDLPFAGFETRFNRIYASMTQAQFDTITVIPDSDTTLGANDFTSDDTYGNGAWGYFNAPINLSDSKPVFSFWLKGKSANFLGVNVYGIIYPREASNPGTYRMSFEVKINTAGENDFAHTH